MDQGVTWESEGRAAKSLENPESSKTALEYMVIVPGLPPDLTKLPLQSCLAC